MSPNYKFRVIFNALDIKYYRYARDIVREIGIPRPTIYWKLANPDAPKTKWTHLTIERCDLPIVKEKVEIKHSYPTTIYAD